VECGRGGTGREGEQRSVAVFLDGAERGFRCFLLLLPSCSVKTLSR
jgi:hypothetical protein